MKRNRLRILLSLVMLLIAAGAIGLFITTQNVRNAPLTVGSGDNTATSPEATAETTPESDEIALCESLPGELAFNSNQAGSWDVLLLDENMTLTNLTIGTDNDEATDMFPSWSLAGTHLNFLSSRLDETTLGPSQFTMETGELLNMDILQAVFITFQNGLFDWDAAYSPDGSRLLWSSLRDLNLELYMIATDGDFEIDNATRLTDRGARDWFAAWSPDGEKVLFSSDEIEGRENVYLLTVESGEIIQLTDSPWDELRPAWSLDGEQILYVYDENDVLPGGELILRMMNADGNKQRPLADEVFSGGAVWSSDGSYAVYFSNESGIFRLYLRDVASERDCMLSDESGDALYPVWRP